MLLLKRFGMQPLWWTEAAWRAETGADRSLDDLQLAPALHTGSARERVHLPFVVV